MKAEYLENELIDSYLDGNLSGDELSAFESRLNLDSGFVSKVNNQKMFNQSLEDYELSKFHNKLDKFNPYKTPKSYNGFKWANLALGTLILSTVIVVVFNLYDSNKEIVSNVVDPIIVEAPIILIKEQKTNRESEPLEPISLGEVEEVIVVESKRNLSMYDFMDDESDVIELSEKVLATTNDGNELVEPFYVVIEKDIVEEDVLVITSDYNKKMHLTEDDNCSSLSFNAKIEMISDCKLEKGIIRVIDPEVSGGKSPYVYAVNENEFQSSLIFEDLEFGEYQVKIRDADGCVIKYHNKVLVESLDCK